MLGVVIILDGVCDTIIFLQRTNMIGVKLELDINKTIKFTITVERYTIVKCNTKRILLTINCRTVKVVET